MALDKGGISGPRKRTHKGKQSPWGIKCVQRGKYWHLVGTFRAKGQSIRVRESTGLSIDRPRAEAEEFRLAKEKELLDEILHGKKPAVSFDEIADKFLHLSRTRDLSPTEVANIKFWTLALTTAGRTRPARELKTMTDAICLKTDDVTQEVVDNVIRLNFPAAKRTTIERYLNTLVAILNFGYEEEMIPNPAPRFRREASARNASSRQEVVDKVLTELEILLIIRHAAPHLKPILAIMASTGGRVSSVLRIRVKDIDLTPGREQVTFLMTKNGATAVSALSPRLVPSIAAWLAQHPHRNSPEYRDGKAFLTQRGVPYCERYSSGGGQMKRAFRTACLSAAAELRKRGSFDRANALAKATPHWFRHSLASNMFKAGADLASVMKQGHWNDMRSVGRYTKAIPDHVRKLVAKLPFTSELTVEGPKAPKSGHSGKGKGGKSNRPKRSKK